MMKRAGSRMLAGTVLLAMSAGACFGGGSVGDTTALVVGRIVGSVRARSSAQQGWYDLAVGMHIPGGSSVQVSPRGDVSLKRGTLTTIEMRPYDDLPAELRVIDAGSVDVVSGDLLVKADKRAPIVVTSQGVTAQPTPSAGVDAAVFRFDRRVSVRVGVYRGEATLRSLTGTLPIPPLREGVVAARALPRAPTPLTVDPNDVWDRTLLPDVIDIDAGLDAQSRGYEAAFGARMKRWQSIAKIAPGRDLNFVTPFLATTGSADVVIGTVFALLLEQHAQGSAAATSFVTLVTLLDEGATWGLLSHEYLGAGGEQTLKDAVTRAIALLTGDISSPAGAISPPSESPTPTPTKSVTPSPTPKHSPSPSPPPSTSPSPSPTASCSALEHLLGLC
ncbi:MAG: hypothetical protein ACXVQ5_09960 [Actinomycetota bacterium]